MTVAELIERLTTFEPTDNVSMSESGAYHGDLWVGNGSINLYTGEVVVAS